MSGNHRFHSRILHAASLEGLPIRDIRADDPADPWYRWPLALRFYKGAIHGRIMLPVVLHALFACIIVFIDQQLDGHLGLPASIV